MQKIRRIVRRLLVPMCVIVPVAFIFLPMFISARDWGVLAGRFYLALFCGFPAIFIAYKISQRKDVRASGMVSAQDSVLALSFWTSAIVTSALPVSNDGMKPSMLDSIAALLTVVAVLTMFVWLFETIRLKAGQQDSGNNPKA